MTMMFLNIYYYITTMHISFFNASLQSNHAKNSPLLQNALIIHMLKIHFFIKIIVGMYVIWSWTYIESVMYHVWKNFDTHRDIINRNYWPVSFRHWKSHPTIRFWHCKCMVSLKFDAQSLERHLKIIPISKRYGRQ